MSENPFARFVQGGDMYGSTSEAPSENAPDPNNPFAKFVAQEPTEPAQQMEMNESTLGSRTWDRFADAWEGTKERFSEWDPTDLTAPHPGVMSVGNELLPAVYGTATDAVVEAGKAVLPEEAEKWIGDKVSAVANSAPVKAVTETVGELAEEYPEAADRISAGVNIAGAIPAGPKVTLRKTKVSDRLSKANKPALDASRAKATANDILPDNPATGGRRNLDLDKKGNQVWSPNDFDIEIADTVKGINKYNPKRSNSYNQSVLRESARTQFDDMVKKIEKQGNPDVNLDSLDDAFSKAISDIPKANRGLYSPEVLKQSQDLATVARDLVRQSDGTVLGMLKARRDFDKYIRKRGNTFDPDFMSARDAANTIIRDVLNTVADESVKGINIKKALTKQHHTLTAYERLLEKALKERTTTMGRVIQRLENATGFKMPTTPLAAAATGVSGAAVAGAYPGVAALLGGVATTITGVRGALWLGSPQGRQWMIKMLKEMEKHPTLGTERALLLDLYNETVQNPIEEEVE